MSHCCASFFVALCCRFARFRSFFGFFFLFACSCAFCLSSLRAISCSFRLRCLRSDLVSLVSVMFSCRWFACIADTGSLRRSASRLATRFASSRFACLRAFDLAFFAAFALASGVTFSNRSCRRRSICYSTSLSSCCSFVSFS